MLVKTRATSLDPLGTAEVYTARSLIEYVDILREYGMYRLLAPRNSGLLASMQSGISRGAVDMSIRDEFSDDEWFLLSATPAMIAAAMSSAAPSGVIGTIKEMTAGMRGTVQGRTEHADSPLIAELLQKAENWDEAKDKARDYRQRSKARLEGAGVTSREALHAQVLADCQAAAALVDERCTTVDADAYKAWSIAIAGDVAKAAKEGGFLGFGGERVSASEQAMLERIESALGTTGGTLLA